MSTIYEPVIGFEIHAELNTKSKVFCGCSTDPTSPENTNCCPVCLGLPGALPVLNKQAAAHSVKVALACNCTVSTPALFERKNYYYPDLPKNYQISQKLAPFGVDGYFDFEVNGETKRVSIVDIHLEEDAGKLVHPTERGATYSLADYNRASVPLLEIVSGPDIHSIDEAISYCEAMRQLLKYLNVSDARMELGQIRFEANVSVRKKGTDDLNKRVEMKNLNSFKTVERAIEYEIERQTELYEAGEEVLQETRLFDEEKGITLAMRSKEDANDYRYFPDPDLPPVIFTAEQLNEIKDEIGELPLETRNRFMAEYELSKNDADIISVEIESAKMLDDAVQNGAKAKTTANWIMGEILRYLNDNNLSFKDITLSGKSLAEMLKMIDSGKINSGQGRQILTEMLENPDKSAEEIAKERGFEQISDTSAIEAIVDEVISQNMDAAEKYKNGEDKPLAFLVGQVMRASKGKANAGVVNEIFKNKLRG